MCFARGLLVAFAYRCCFYLCACGAGVFKSQLALRRAPGRSLRALLPVPLSLRPCLFFYIRNRSKKKRPLLFWLSGRYRRQLRAVRAASFLRSAACPVSGCGQTCPVLRPIYRIIWHYVKYQQGQKSAPLAAGLGLSGGGACSSWLLSSARPARWTLIVVASRLFCARSCPCPSFSGFASLYLGGG